MRIAVETFLITPSRSLRPIFHRTRLRCPALAFVLRFPGFNLDVRDIFGVPLDLRPNDADLGTDSNGLVGVKVSNGSQLFCRSRVGGFLLREFCFETSDWIDWALREGHGGAELRPGC